VDEFSPGLARWNAQTLEWAFWGSARIITVAKSKGETVDLEQSLGELERLVEQLEQGDLPLESSLELFEHGVGLTRRCQTALRDAEQRVEKLLDNDGEPQIVPLEQEPDSESEVENR